MFLTFHQNLKVRMSCALFYMSLEDGISKALPEGSKAAFDEFVHARVDLSDMACEEDFVAGYQLGVRMMLAGIDKDSLG